MRKSFSAVSTSPSCIVHQSQFDNVCLFMHYKIGISSLSPMRERQPLFPTQRQGSGLGIYFSKMIDLRNQLARNQIEQHARSAQSIRNSTKPPEIARERYAHSFTMKVTYIIITEQIGILFLSGVLLQSFDNHRSKFGQQIETRRRDTKYQT